MVGCDVAVMKARMKVLKVPVIPDVHMKPWIFRRKKDPAYISDFPEVRYETTKIYEFYMKGILGGTAIEQTAFSLAAMWIKLF